MNWLNWRWLKTDDELALTSVQRGRRAARRSVRDTASAAIWGSLLLSDVYDHRAMGWRVFEGDVYVYGNDVFVALYDPMLPQETS